MVIFVPLELWKEPRGLNSDLVGDLENAWREQRFWIAEIAVLIGAFVLGAVTTAIAAYYRKDVKRSEIKQARIKLGLDVDAQPSSEADDTRKEVQHA